MRESDLLQRIYQRSAGPGFGPGSTSDRVVLVGPGDDCAVVRADGKLLLTVDQLIEGRHVLAPLVEADSVTPNGTGVSLAARKAVARSVSDIAAMGGRPLWALATAALAKDFPQALADKLFDAMARWADHWGCPLVGGDIASLPAGQPAMLTVTIGGAPHPLRGPVLRSGARAGDLVWVTGAIGGAFRPSGAGRHITFEPRLREAAWLCDTLGERLHAMIDLSDGLGRDAGRVARASGVDLLVEDARVPRHPEAGPTALADGEDYELLFTTSADVALPGMCPGTGTLITCIGRAEPAGADGAGGVCQLLEPDGRRRDAGEMGWDH